jgi:hypothetical protein
MGHWNKHLKRPERLNNSVRSALRTLRVHPGDQSSIDDVIIVPDSFRPNI